MTFTSLDERKQNQTGEIRRIFCEGERRSSTGARQVKLEAGEQFSSRVGIAFDR